MLFVVSFYWLLPSTPLAIHLNPAIYFTKLKCLLQRTYCGTFDLNVLFLLNCSNVCGQPSSSCASKYQHRNEQEKKYNHLEKRLINQMAQRDSDRLEKCADRNLIKFNKDKCKVLKLGRNNPMHQEKLWEAAWQQNKILASWQTQGWAWASNVPLQERMPKPPGCTGNSSSSRSRNVIIPLIQPWWDHVWSGSSSSVLPRTDGIKTSKGLWRRWRDWGSFMWEEAEWAGAVGLREAQGMLGMWTSAWEQTGKRMEPDFSEVQGRSNKEATRTNLNSRNSF